MKIAIVLYCKELPPWLREYPSELRKRGHEVKEILTTKDFFLNAMKEVPKFNPDVVWTWNGKFDWYEGTFYKLKQMGYRIVCSEFAWLPQKENNFICEFNDDFHNCTYAIPDNFPIDYTAIQKVKESYGLIERPINDSILVPFQIQTDTSILHRSEMIKHMKALCDHARYLFPDKNIVYTQHPLDTEREVAAYEKYVGTESTLQLATEAHHVVAINSTVTIETLLWHDRITCFGRNPAFPLFYKGANEERRHRVLSYLLKRQHNNATVSQKVLNYLETKVWDLH